MHSPLLPHLSSRVPCASFSVLRFLRLCPWLLPLVALHLSALCARAQVPDIAVRYLGGADIVDAGTVNFNSVNVGASSVKNFQIVNTGTASLLGIVFSLNGAHSADYSHNGVNQAILGVGSTINFSITFHPGASTTRTAALHIASNDPNENPYDINLTGMGVAPDIGVTAGAATLTDGVSTINFGKVRIGLSGTRQLTIRNTGNVTLSGLSLSLSGSGYSITSLQVTSLSAGANTSVTLSFTPSDTFTSPGTLQIFSNDSDENPFDINLTGSGVIPLVEVEAPPGSPQIFDGAENVFTAPAGVQASRQVLLRNISASSLTGLSLSIDGTDPDKFSFAALPSTTLAPGATLTFTLTFSPPEIAAYTAALHIAYDQSPSDPFDIALTGNGVTLPDDGDQDEDGVLNMLEAAMGTDPLTPDYSPGVLVKNGADLEFALTRSVSGQNTYNLWVEYADNPSGLWTPLDSGFLYLDGQSGDVQQVRYIFPAGNAGRRYARIRATKL